LQFQQNIEARCKFLIIIKELNYFFSKKGQWTGCISPVDWWPVVHGGLRVVVAKGLARAQPHGRFWAQKLAMAASNQSWGGGGLHRGLLRSARWREEAGAEEE
jgi:hypothetical protein